MDEFATGKANVYNEEKKLTSEIVPSVFAKETFNEFSSFPAPISKVDEVSKKSFVGEQSALSEDFVGQSTPMDRSFATNDDGEPFLDASRVEITEELQKQQNERLERLWKHQSDQNEKIFEQLDASMTRQNRNACLREQHARQLEDLRRYYEGEITGLKKQLSDMKNVIFQNKQQDSSVKDEIQKEFENLSQANLELSSKCDALESAKTVTQNHLKQVNIRKQELENQCQQLLATNQIIDGRCKELKKVREETLAKVKELDEQRDKLKTKCDLTSKEKLILRRAKEELERNYNQLQDDYQKLADKSHRWKEESKTHKQRTKLQETLVEKTNKNVRELELVVKTLKRELEDKKVKHEVDKSLLNATQQRVDRLVVQNRDKDLTIEDLERKVGSLEKKFKEVTASAAKVGLNEIRESIQRDKELLKRVLHEYDSLSEKHEKTKGQVQTLEGKLAKSQGEGDSLRKELSEANISRRNLQNSLRDVMGNESSCRRILERSSPRRTWEQPAMVNYHLKEDGGSLKYRDPKESTRRFCAEKVDTIDLSHVHSHGYAKYDPGSDKIQHRHGYDEEDSLVCSYCNQVYKKEKNTSFEKYGSSSVPQHSAHTRFNKYDFVKRMDEPMKQERLSSSRNITKSEEDAVERRANQVSTEKRFLDLSDQRRRLESAMRKVNSSRMSRQDKEDRKFLEKKLDEVLMELGKVRLQLRSNEME